MAARVPTLLFLGVATVAAAGAMYFVPDVSASEDNTHATPAVVAAAPAPVARVVAQLPAADDTNCKAQAWPYLSAACDADGSARAARSRQVRVISTDRDAPRAVPLPADVAAAIQPEPAPVVVAEGETIAILPPARPADLGAAQSADAGAATGDVDVTGSTKPAPAVVAPVKRRVARATRTIRTDDRNLDMDQVATYRDSYGREFVVRSPAPQEPRQVFADDGMGARYGRPARNDNPLAWLTGSQF